MSEEATAPPSAGKRLLQIAKLLVGLGILVWVFVGLIGWRDSIVLPDGSTHVGEIVGEVPSADGWKTGERVRFREDGSERDYAAADLAKDKGGEDPAVNEGLVRLVKRSNTGLLIVGLVLYGLTTQIGVTRWWLLLRAQGIHVSYYLAHRLTFLGFFFNNVVPGPTGGDLVKAVYIARRTHKRAEAVVTIVVDRVVGLVALALIATVALLFQLDRPEFRELAVFIAVLLAALAVAAMLFFSRRARRFLRLDKLSEKLPGAGLIRQADEAIFRWRQHKRAVVVALLLSFANQLSIQCMMVFCFAAGLHVTTKTGAEVPFGTYMIVLPVALIVSALPVLPGGWGVRELAFVVAFSKVGVERNPAIALSVLNGMTGLFWSVLGGVYFLVDRFAAPATPLDAPSEKAGTVS